MTQLCEEGFKKQYPQATDEHHKRLEYELSIIKQVGFAGYFLIVADFVNEAYRTPAAIATQAAVMLGRASQ